jgi:hypothetical protein
MRRMIMTPRHELPSPRRLTPRRSGVAALENAFVLPVTFLLLFALLDLGLATVRYNSLAETARQVARGVIIHGSLAPALIGTWGPGEFNGTAADGHDMVRLAQATLPTMRPGDVTIRVTWPDSDNSPRDRVRVETTYRHQPLIPGLFMWGPLDLRSETLMRIVN